MPRKSRKNDSTFTFDASRNEGFRYSTKIQNMQTYNTVQDNIFVHESTTDSQASFIFESDEETGQKVKRRPWETIKQALEREAREKEVARLQKLMKFAYPRRREEHLYKKKLLNPED